MDTVDVVTAFIRSHGKILLLQRSQKVGSYRGCWAGVSGYLEQDTALQQALTEIREETGLQATQVALQVEAAVLEVKDSDLNRCWRVHPFLFELDDDTADIHIDWEHDGYQWLDPNNMRQLETVPLLIEAYQRCVGGNDGV
ncbi:NUDIX pyrophosphatase [Desulfuromonas acetoxidans]|uniref:NUDIX hydrolase n=1 Tax=Desulfuromonas acetoxidans (strain DSM 684 / 11070) TaxID=281689 RepID=Q1K389_DESA6|nr:NUDIX pyrophosphatase [Desulfuromonas acetoxidans]EAT17085.1 NUDIX hydrolase [Desulfuromonas acetoxidans DSM 684]MBF0645104.1 NUDIX pyrophosphatase [Desulfuromonas acetoxidans]NVD24092.1 NUDIX pyrophosphatase [Desulfuromonas acetoxidans]NVE16388.1 NUDIX pyrophosphatase [Desulfuromonas acetoxidans]